MVVETLVDKKTNADKRLREKHTITSRAMNSFDRQVWNAAVYTVRKSTDSGFYGDNLGTTIEEADPEQTNQCAPLLTRVGSAAQIKAVKQIAGTMTAL
ncbi:hypothetical protein JG687_00012243 [Phytophthora cactorum]|uniref:Uncharacterized protein n=1 Tax=Phytophthora cactorum TaxID=29920 RepID=A0A8T1U6Z5_9STRA|nr:hypothetical protein JG687_00012243 [Phytophthora cactorum]